MALDPILADRVTDYVLQVETALAFSTGESCDPAEDVFRLADTAALVSERSRPSDIAAEIATLSLSSKTVDCRLDVAAQVLSRVVEELSRHETVLSERLATATEAATESRSSLVSAVLAARAPLDAARRTLPAVVAGAAALEETAAGAEELATLVKQGDSAARARKILETFASAASAASSTAPEDVGTSSSTIPETESTDSSTAVISPQVTFWACEGLRALQLRSLDRGLAALQAAISGAADHIARLSPAPSPTSPPAYPSDALVAVIPGQAIFTTSDGRLYTVVAGAVRTPYTGRLPPSPLAEAGYRLVGVTRSGTAVVEAPGERQPLAAAATGRLAPQTAPYITLAELNAAAGRELLETPLPPALLAEIQDAARGLLLAGLAGECEQALLSITMRLPAHTEVDRVVAANTPHSQLRRRCPPELAAVHSAGLPPPDLVAIFDPRFEPFFERIESDYAATFRLAILVLPSPEHAVTEIFKRLRDDLLTSLCTYLCTRVYSPASLGGTNSTCAQILSAALIAGLARRLRRTHFNITHAPAAFPYPGGPTQPIPGPATLPQLAPVPDATSFVHGVLVDAPSEVALLRALRPPPPHVGSILDYLLPASPLQATVLVGVLDDYFGRADAACQRAVLVRGAAAAGEVLQIANEVISTVEGQIFAAVDVACHATAVYAGLATHTDTAVWVGAATTAATVSAISQESTESIIRMTSDGAMVPKLSISEIDRTVTLDMLIQWENAPAELVAASRTDDYVSEVFKTFLQVLVNARALWASCDQFLSGAVHAQLRACGDTDQRYTAEHRQRGRGVAAVIAAAFTLWRRCAVALVRQQLDQIDPVLFLRGSAAAAAAARPPVMAAARGAAARTRREGHTRTQSFFSAVQGAISTAKERGASRSVDSDSLDELYTAAQSRMLCAAAVISDLSKTLITQIQAAFAFNADATIELLVADITSCVFQYIAQHRYTEEGGAELKALTCTICNALSKFVQPNSMAEKRLMCLKEISSIYQVSEGAVMGLMADTVLSFWFKSNSEELLTFVKLRAH